MQLPPSSTKIGSRLIEITSKMPCVSSFSLTAKVSQRTCRVANAKPLFPKRVRITNDKQEPTPVAPNTRRVIKKATSRRRPAQTSPQGFGFATVQRRGGPNIRWTLDEQHPMPTEDRSRRLALAALAAIQKAVAAHGQPHPWTASGHPNVEATVTIFT